MVAASSRIGNSIIITFVNAELISVEHRRQHQVIDKSCYTNRRCGSKKAVCKGSLCNRTYYYDTATYWSEFGQAIILTLIQIGGMGVMTIAVAIAVASGRKTARC